MSSPDFTMSRVVVFSSALVYWAGVYIQARRIRRQIGRQPNLKPRGTKERVLWAGWVLVVLSWLALPFLAGVGQGPSCLRIIPSLCGPASLFSGLALIGAGYAGTLWCYAAMGNTWRIGVNRAEKTLLVTRGPFQFIRHPLYVFQVLMLAGVAVLLPTPLAFLVLAIHILCILAKAVDEEHYLRAVHGEAYGNYLSRTGRFFPKLRGR